MFTATAGVAMLRSERAWGLIHLQPVQQHPIHTCCCTKETLQHSHKCMRCSTDQPKCVVCVFAFVDPLSPSVPLTESAKIELPATPEPNFSFWGTPLQVSKFARYTHGSMVPWCRAIVATGHSFIIAGYLPYSKFALSSQVLVIL